MGKLLILLLFIITVLLVLRFQNGQYREFLNSASKVTGIIINKEELVKRPDQPNRKEYWVVYSYNVGGVDYIGRDSVEYPDIWQDIQENQRLEVYYMRENPKLSHPVILLDRRLK